MLKANVVSRVLKAAGHKRSETHTTRIRGWYSVAAGFEVRQVDETDVRVYYRSDFLVRDWAISDRELREYAATLREKGYGVSEVRSDYGDHLNYLRVFKES